MKKLGVFLAVTALLFAFTGAALAADGGHQGTRNTTVTTTKTTVVEVKEVKTVTVLQKLVNAAQTVAAVTTKVVETVTTKVESIITTLSTSTTTTIPQDVITAGVQEVTEDTFETVTARSESSTQAIVEAFANGTASSSEGKKEVAAAVLPPMTPKKSGIFTFPMPKMDSSYYGKKINWNNYRAGGTRALVAEITDGDTATFLDSTGAEITVVPDGTGDAEAGVVNVATYMKAGETYNPVITVDAEELADDTSLTEAEEFTAVATANGSFSTFVSEDILAEITGGKKLADTEVATGTTTVSSALQTKLGEDHTYAALPRLSPAADGLYVMKLDFAALGFNGTANDYIDDTLTLWFGDEAATEAVVAVDVGNGYAFINAAATGKIYNVPYTTDRTAYLAVRLTGGQTYAPTVSVELVDTEEPTNRNTSSSSGCNAGLGVAALLLAAALPLRKVKK